MDRLRSAEHFLKAGKIYIVLSESMLYRLKTAAAVKSRKKSRQTIDYVNVQANILTCLHSPYVCKYNYLFW